jgi:L-fuconolactonase
MKFVPSTHNGPAMQGGLSQSQSVQSLRSPTAKRIDAHHHLWQYRAAEFGWIDDSMAALRRDFLVDDLERELQRANVDATVAVQARESLDETRWLLECAHRAPVICGVVGWAPLESEDLPDILHRFDDTGKLVGLREIVQGKAPGYLDRQEFHRGIKQLTSLDLTYDILIHEHQLIEAARFVDQHPHQRFVLDHAAKPKISKSELEPWRNNLRALAQRSNVFCKISGLVTEADWQHWSLQSLRPYLDVCVEAFGPHRLLAGSDWPVCLVASSYAQWWELLTLYFADFSETEIRRIFAETAIDIYRLSHQ